MTTPTENQNAETITASIQADKVEIEIIDGVEYKLFHNDRGPAFRVKDLASGEVVGLTVYKSEAKAGETFDAAVAYARRVVV